MAPVRRRRKLKQRRKQPNQPNQGQRVGWNDLPIELKEPIYKYVLDLTNEIVPLACPIRRAQEINDAQGRWIPHESFYRGLSMLAANGAMRDEAKRAMLRWRGWLVPVYSDILKGVRQVRLTHDGPTPDNYIELLRQVVRKPVRRYIMHIVMHMEHMNCLRERRSANGANPLTTSADLCGFLGTIDLTRTMMTVWCPTFEEGWKFLEILPCLWHAGALDFVRGMKTNVPILLGPWNRDVAGNTLQGRAALRRFPTPAIWARDWKDALSSRHLLFQFNRRLEFPISERKMAQVIFSRWNNVILRVVSRSHSICGWSYEPRQRPDTLPGRLKVPGNSLRRSARLA